MKIDGLEIDYGAVIISRQYAPIVEFRFIPFLNPNPNGLMIYKREDLLALRDLLIAEFPLEKP